MISLPHAYLVTTLRNFTIFILPLAFLHHHTLYMMPLFWCLTCFVATLVLQPVWFDVGLVVLLIVVVVGFVKTDPIILFGMIPAKKIIRTLELLTELKDWYGLIQQCVKENVTPRFCPFHECQSRFFCQRGTQMVLRQEEHAGLCGRTSCDKTKIKCFFSVIQLSYMCSMPSFPSFTFCLTSVAIAMSSYWEPPSSTGKDLTTKFMLKCSFLQSPLLPGQKKVVGKSTPSQVAII